MGCGINKELLVGVFTGICIACIKKVCVLETTY